MDLQGSRLLSPAALKLQRAEFESYDVVPNAIVYLR